MHMSDWSFLPLVGIPSMQSGKAKPPVRYVWKFVKFQSFITHVSCKHGLAWSRTRVVSLRCGQGLAAIYFTSMRWRGSLGRNTPEDFLGQWMHGNSLMYARYIQLQLIVYGWIFTDDSCFRYASKICPVILTGLLSG